MKLLAGGLCQPAQLCDCERPRCGSRFVCSHLEIAGSPSALLPTVHCETPLICVCLHHECTLSTSKIKKKGRISSLFPRGTCSLSRGAPDDVSCGDSDAAQLSSYDHSKHYAKPNPNLTHCRVEVPAACALSVPDAPSAPAAALSRALLGSVAATVEPARQMDTSTCDR